jgi:hypothetical protein
MVEMVAAMAISAILVTLIFQFFSMQTDNYVEGRQSAEMQQELRWAMQYVLEHAKLAGNGIPPTCGWPAIENIDGGADPDTLSILGSFTPFVVTTTQTMANEGSQVKVNDTNGIEAGDLVVISDGTFQEIFMVTSISSDLHLWHATELPWNDDIKLDHAYTSGSSCTIASHYKFFIDDSDTDHPNLMIETQSYSPQILAGDIDEFQVRFKMKSGDWVDEILASEVYDIRMIEVTIRARSQEPLRDYVDTEYGDAYKRIVLRSMVVPKNLVIM